MNSSTERRLSRRALIVNNEFESNSASGRAACALRDELVARDVDVVLSHSMADAAAIVASDTSLQVVVVDWDLEGDNKHAGARNLLKRIRERNATIPIFLSATRSEALDHSRRSDAAGGRFHLAAGGYARLHQRPHPRRHRPLSHHRSCRRCSAPWPASRRVHEYSWHTPGHRGGIAFLKHPAGRAFFEFFGEELFRSDLSISVGELGSLLDHSGADRRRRTLCRERVRRAPHLLRDQRLVDVEPRHPDGERDARPDRACATAIATSRSSIR